MLRTITCEEFKHSSATSFWWDVCAFSGAEAAFAPIKKVFTDKERATRKGISVEIVAEINADVFGH